MPHILPVVGSVVCGRVEVVVKEKEESNGRQSSLLTQRALTGRIKLILQIPYRPSEVASAM
jgi:hypothetical protein